MRMISIVLALLQAAPAWAQNMTGAAAPGSLGLPAAAAGARATTPAAPMTGTTGLTGPALQPALTVAPQVEASQAAPAAAQTNGFALMTGALARSQKDPGPVKRMWLVHGSEAELAEVQEALAKVKAENPGVEVLTYSDASVIPPSSEKGKRYDATAEGRKVLFDRMLREETEFVLATNQDIYEHFRGLRDSNLARLIPMGFAGRKYVSVDMPRASLDPAKLSDPKAYQARRYLWLGEESGTPARLMAGMEGIRKSLEGAVEEGGVEGHSYEFGFVSRVGMQLLMKLAGQADPRSKARLRKEAHRLAGYLDKEKIDVLVTGDPKATKVIALMKRMGYHKSLPVVWTDRKAPPDASGLNVALAPADWQAEAPHVQVSPKPTLPEALAFAKGVERVPENFMEMGGVTVRDFVPAVAEAVDKAIPGSKPRSGRYDVHFMLTNGNGVSLKGDANPFGHFGMAVTDEKGKAQVWTVQYNDGGSFTGGLGDGKQLSLSEYLYSLWYLPGAVGQAIPLAETAVSPVFDFILRGADEAQIEAMRRKAAEINARHLKGQDNYRFLNEGGMTNCISLVTQILRAAGFRIPETGIQDPAGQAFNMVKELSRWLLSGRVGVDDFGLVVFERPAHAGPAHYRIANTALASPLFNREKPWQKMSWWEKVKRGLAFPFNLRKAMQVPDFLERFAGLASHRVVVGPNSRDAEIVENPSSPILKMRAARGKVVQLRTERVPMMESLGAVEARIIKAIGFEDWQPNPAQTLEEQAREAPLDAEAKARLEIELAKHRELEVALALNRIDEQIELRRVEFLTLQLADPTGRYANRTDPLRLAYVKVLGYRDRVQTEDRVLTAAEIEELDQLNSRIERELEAVRLQLLKDAGPAIPQSIKMILGQIDAETLKDLQDIGQGGGKGKGDGKDDKGK